MADKEHSPCRICGGVDGKRFTAHGALYMRCARCASLTKVLTPEEFQALDRTYDPGAYLDSRDPKEIADFLEIGEKAKLIDGVLARYWQGDLSKAAFLDVGCGMGGYLLAMQRQGVDVLGFEPSANHSRVARELLGLPVVMDYFSADKVGGRTFDFIMLSHVIEHIYAPDAFLHELISVLRPGGVLLIMTPNTQAFVARLTGAAWPMLVPIDHVSLLNKRSYDYFHLPDRVTVHHESSEYPHEFAATLASVLLSRLRRAPAPANSGTAEPEPAPAEPALQRTRKRVPFMIPLLTAASFPAHMAARLTGEQACLVSLIVAKR